MKNALFSLIISVGLANSLFANDEEIVKSKITEVTVYAQGAQIFQNATYSVKSGITEVVIDGVSPNLDPKSLQVKATGNIIILDSKYSLYYPEPKAVDLSGLPLKIRKSISMLEDSLKNLGFDLQEIQDEIDVMNAAKHILANNGAIRGQGKVNDSINLLKQAMEYYTLKMNEINKKLLSLNKRKTEKVETKSEMNDRLAELRNYQNNENLKNEKEGPSHRITITVSAKDLASGKMNISYLVADAGWVPLYDLRSDVSTGKINLSYKAQVFQNTGVDWDGVQLNISTNNPYQNKTKPDLHPWYIDYNNYQQTYTESNKEMKRDMRLNSMPPASQQGYYKAQSEEQEAETADQFTSIINHTISAEFKIDLPYTIKSNNQEHMVLVKNDDLSATFRYFAIPKLDNGVYLVAELTKLDDLQLVPAKANIFFDGSYMGETYLDPGTMDDTLRLSLGKDPNIVTKRTLLKTEMKEKIVGSNKERTFAYSIEIKSLKSTNVEVVVLDQIPVTTNSEIEIKLTNSDRAYHDERTGLLKWTFTLKAKDRKDLKFTYEVKHNKDLNIYL